MPKSLTDDAASFPTQTSPLAGEPRTAGSVETPFQRAANRAAWLKDRLLYIDPDKGGVRRPRRFASIAAMKASTDIPVGTTALVDGVGTYQFIADRTDELDPVVVRPTSIGPSDPGRWIVVGVGFGLLGAANGVPKLESDAKLEGPALQICDGAGRVTQDNIVRGVIDQAWLDVNANTLIAQSPTWEIVTGSAIDTTTDTTVGDVIVVDYQVLAGPVAGDVVGLRVQIVKPDLSTVEYVATAYKSPTGGFAMMVPLMRNILATQNGSHTVRLQANGSNTNTSTATISNVVARLSVVRP